MKFLHDEFNLIQVLKLVGGICGLILLFLIYKDIEHVIKIYQVCGL